MNSKYTALFHACVLMLLTNSAALGQPGGTPRIKQPILAATAAPTITIVSAATGVPVRSLGAGNSSLDLGSVSYYKGTSTPGETSQKDSTSFVVSTRFALRVDCPGSLASSQVSVTMARLDAAASHAIAVDGTKLGLGTQILTPSLTCGSAGEHTLAVEVPLSTPAGPIGSTVAFVATLKR
jgi:hypothetical protein